MASSVEENDNALSNTIIPVLSVVKNNSILKNIFIFNNKNFNPEHRNFVVVVVGRHPDCDIVVNHPSISRFHLQLLSQPFSRVLSLRDLSSVHGTFVNGRKLEAGETVELVQGDTFTLGVSTRVYHLNFVPLTLSQFNMVHQDQQQLLKDVSFCTVGNEKILSMDAIPERNNSLVPDVNLELALETHIPLPEDMVSFGSDEERNNHLKDQTFGVLSSRPLGAETSYHHANSDIENNPCDCQSHVLAPPYIQSVDESDSTEKTQACPEVVMPGETNLFSTFREYLKENICLPVVEVVQGIQMQQVPDTLNTSLPPTKQEASFEENWPSSVTNMDLASFDEKHHAAVPVIPEESEFGCTVRDNDKAEDILTAEAIRILNSENTCLLAGEVIPDSKFHQIKNVEEVSTDSPPCGEKQDKGVAAVIVAPEESEFGCTIGDNDRIEDNITNGASIFNSENTSLLVKEVIPVTNFQQIHIVEGVGDDSISDGENQDTCGKEFEPKLQAQLADKFCHEQLNSLNEIVEDTGNKCAGSICPVSEWVESLNSLVSQEAVLEVTDEKENQTLQSLIAVAGCSDIESLESHVETKESGKYSHDQGLKVLETVEASEDIGNNCTGSISPMSVLVESVNSPVPQEADLRITNEKENQTPQSLIGMTGSSDIEVPESRVEATEKSCSNVWSRRGTAASAPRVRTRKSKFTSTHCYKKDIIHKTMSKDIFSVLDEKEIFTPNKENFSPNTLNLLFMRKKGELEGIKHSKSQRSQDSKSNFNFSPNIYSDERITAVSNKGNRSLKVTQEQKSRRRPLLECHMNLAQKQDTMDMKKKRVERIPFQSLMNSGSKSKSRTSGPVSAAKSIDWGQISDKLTKPSLISGGQKKSWIMVVDTASLLNKESRKALHLLQGLKGTRLIIPRLVIRELDNMKRQHFSIFRRTSQASLALEWIEECMENTEWWIHIQGAMEEHMLIAPTPPAASPRTQFVEDHILDLALLYRRTENDGQLVLLSDDVTLKIKSMAEGLLCETVQEFRQSLVNPFSERFMWANSSSRGLTWSCKDDVVLREKYCGLPSKAGLKLFTEEFLYFPSKCNFSRL